MSGGEDPGWVGTVIDVSKWQSSLPDLSGVLGVIARAGIGTSPDTMFAAHITAARKAGLWVGSYWYNWGSLSISDQVDAYIAREKAVGGVNLHVLDWEGNEGFTAAQSAEFMRIYKARTGDPIGLYASEGRYRELGQDWRWIANYSQEPAKVYDMWQYGPFRRVDGNHARQRILDLVKESTMAQATITSEVAKIVTKAANSPFYDLDGTTVVAAGASALGPRPSPYGVGTKRAIYATIGGVRRTALIKPATVADIVDPTKFSDTDIAAAKAEQLAADQAAIDAANAARDAAQTALATAAAVEHERLALALAAKEADRVRST